jgi:glycosyltransferase involved in cell wall biosynthesis
MSKDTINQRLSPPGTSRVVFMNRSYWPDAEATGQLLTELCEDLSSTFDVTVIAGQPNDNPSGATYRRRGTQIRQGVRIRRVWHTRFPKRFLPGRIVNYLSFLWGAFWLALWMKRPDVVAVETDPLLLCLIGRFLQRLRRAKLVVYLQDIHPDIGVALGKLRNGPLVRLIRRILVGVYCKADLVVVLSRDMREYVIAEGIDPTRVVCIPNWVDTRHVRPVKIGNSFRHDHKLSGKFVVMYSGNLGLCQRLEDVIDAAEYLLRRSEILFLLVGSGSFKPQLVEQVFERGLTNVRFLPSQPKSRLAESLSAADVHLVPLDPRVSSLLMPSKLYGVLASGTPLVAIAPVDCELAELTCAHQVGVVSSPGNPERLAAAIESLACRHLDVCDMGARARHLAEEQFDRRPTTARFALALRDILGLDSPAVASNFALPAIASETLTAAVD